MRHLEPEDLPRRELIARLMARDPDNTADVAVDLWERMSLQIVSIVGEQGFNSLYRRSVFLAQPTYPWLAASPPPQQRGQYFAELRKGLEGQTPSHARDANSLLLLTFTGILAALIGDPLTTRMVRSAWGDDAPSSTSKGFTHE